MLRGMLASYIVGFVVGVSILFIWSGDDTVCLTCQLLVPPKGCNIVCRLDDCFVAAVSRAV